MEHNTKEQDMTSESTQRLTKSPLTLSVSLVVMLFGAGCPDETTEETSGPLDITEMDFSVDQVLEDRVSEPGAVDYYTTGPLEVDAKLTIKPGVVIEFGQDTHLRVQGGTLDAQGAAQAKVTLRPSSGATWAGLGLISTNPHKLTHTTIQGAGSIALSGAPVKAAFVLGLDTNPAKATLDTVRVEDSAGYGLHIGAGSEFSSQALHIKNSALNAINLEDLPHITMLGDSTTFEGEDGDVIDVTAYIEEDSALSFAVTGLPLRFESGIKLSAEGSLTIKPGVELRFEPQTGLQTAGRLLIQGTAQAPVTLGAANQMNAGWNGVRLMSGDAHSIEHAIITQGGQEAFDFSPERANIVVGTELVTSTLTIKNSTISKSGGAGIFLYNLVSAQAFTQEGLTFEDNANGDIVEPAE